MLEFLTLALAPLGGILNRIRGGGFKSYKWRIDSTQLWRALTALVMISPILMLHWVASPVYYASYLLMFGAVWGLGFSFGWGRYFTIGRNQKFRDQVEVGWIDCIIDELYNQFEEKGRVKAAAMGMFLRGLMFTVPLSAITALTFNDWGWVALAPIGGLAAPIYEIGYRMYLKLFKKTETLKQNYFSSMIEDTIPSILLKIQNMLPSFIKHELKGRTHHEMSQAPINISEFWFGTIVTGLIAAVAIYM